MFTEKFQEYACEGDRITCEVDGFTITARIERDDDMGPPWKEHDGHGPVSEWVRRGKRPGERVLSEDRGSKRYYDWQEAIEIARRDGWDAKPYGTGTKGEQAERAVKSDFDAMKAWCDDEWSWCMVVLAMSKNGIELEDYAACLGGIELNHPQSDSGNDYLTEVANDMLDEAVEAGKEAMRTLTQDAK